MAAKRASTSRGSPRPARARSRSRRETAAEKRERVAREARNARARERRAERKREAELAEQKRLERNRRARERRVERRAEEARRFEQTRAQAEILRRESAEDLARARRNARDRERRAKKKREAEEAAGPRVPPPGYVPVSGAPHPPATAMALVEAQHALLYIRPMLAQVAKDVQGRWRTYLYPDTAEIEGKVAKHATENMDLVETVTSFGDAFSRSVTNLYYRDLYFQAYAEVVVSGAGKGKKKGGSPLNESRIGPDGKTYRKARTQWYLGDVQKCLAAAKMMTANVVASSPSFELVEFGVEAYLSPIGARPHRLRKKNRRKERRES